MKVVILAGGFGTRISEESHLKPKPMIEIGGQPILWHIMKYYSSYGFNDFVILAGYKQNIIKEYFANYFIYNSDITFNLATNERKILNQNGEDWKVTVLDTGLNTMTGGRILRAKEYLDKEPFMLTYGDGVCDVDLEALLKFHNEKKTVATLTTVSISQQKGVIDVGNDGYIQSFKEKDEKDEVRINGGFMVIEPTIFHYLKDDTTIFEQTPLRKLAEEHQLTAFEHNGFWQCMDTQREKEKLERLIATNKAPWVRW